MIIAITGNIGSGKSTAAALFENYGREILRADLIGHEMYHREDIKGAVIKRFGEKILTDGEVDRRKLKEIVFSDPDELKALNAIVHPEIVQYISQKAKEFTHVVVEGALLIEAGFKDHDVMILLTIDKDIQIKRLLERGKYNKEEILNIIAAQMPQEDKIAYADYVVDNSGTVEEFKENLIKIIRSLE
ncbi:dephospho-CoA kinase [Candidatus Woesearchaeota archaeon]|nr:dephospho-CoA kinase [Candidatus Woesearchaeota archaeon]